MTPTQRRKRKKFKKKIWVVVFPSGEWGLYYSRAVAQICSKGKGEIMRVFVTEL